ncbi:MAG: hypothetical protein HOP12_15510 [Candidatus Eisenbacteria bacterium]|uniref:ATP-binding protein n=1 Tax=Eiseniibacteriota bacterium TaxID=2212470 RepID=A0A849SM83_UNCEI|nr:hypothetical protein [Candidatus Eisenbacteria bacterium]
MEDRLLTEIQRQQKYLDELGPEFTFPLFNPKHAMDSQRRNGYRNTAAAAREIVDNSIEAGAKKVHVVFERAAASKVHGRTESVTAIAFIDDGAGMLPQMARCALCLGGGTHFDEASFIGKFGFGLPNSSINQTKRVEVYTKTEDDPAIYMTYLDVNEVQHHGRVDIPEAVEKPLPRFVQRHLEKSGFNFDHGTVVVWVEPDRLTRRSGALLKEHLVDDFGVVYRYLLDNFELEVDGLTVEKVDPLFLDPKARLYAKPEDGGATLARDWAIAVKLVRNGSETGHLERVQPDEDLLKDENIIAAGVIEVRIAHFPIGLVEGKNEFGDDAKKRMEIKKSRPGISFVRANREIDTITNLPRSQRDKSNGMGNWPLLQGYIYNVGCEVRFQPSLDEAFGITNDKQSVRPLEDFWKILSAEEVDMVFSKEYRWHPVERRRLKDERNKVTAEPSQEASPAEKAAATADMVQGTVPKAPETERPTLRRKFDAEAERQSKVTGETIEEVKKALEKQAKFRPYLIDYFDDPNAPFYVPEWTPAGQVLVKVNRQHPFFETLYSATLVSGQGARLKYGMDVLLLMLGRAELTAEHDHTKMLYEAQRVGIWSPFLRNSLKVLEQALQDQDEIEESLEDDEAPATA